MRLALQEISLRAPVIFPTPFLCRDNLAYIAKQLRDAFSPLRIALIMAQQMAILLHHCAATARGYDDCFRA